MRRTPAATAPRVFPSGSYFLHIAMMHDGDYQKALDGFRSDFTFGLQAAGTHWVDSICYLTMAGECLNRMGRPAEALDDYNAALKLYLAFPNWMMGIQFPANIARCATRRPTPWGQSERRTQLGQFPAAMFLIADTVLADPIPPPNGSSRFTAAGQPVLANVQEIARATALALKRRRELLGPVCPYDPLTAAVAALFARRPAGGNPCAQAWLDAEQGLAYLDKGQTTDAIRLLNSAAAIGGDLDHPLTPLVLLESGNCRSKRAIIRQQEANYWKRATRLPTTATMRCSKKRSAALSKRISHCIRRERTRSSRPWKPRPSGRSAAGKKCAPRCCC